MKTLHRYCSKLMFLIFNGTNYQLPIWNFTWLIYLEIFQWFTYYRITCCTLIPSEPGHLYVHPGQQWGGGAHPAPGHALTLAILILCLRLLTCAYSHKLSQEFPEHFGEHEDWAGDSPIHQLGHAPGLHNIPTSSQTAFGSPGTLHWSQLYHSQDLVVGLVFGYQYLLEFVRFMTKYSEKFHQQVPYKIGGLSPSI